MFTALIFLAVLSLLVLSHEAGHYFVARRSGMDVEEFGFGFPPRLFSWTRRGTIYSFNLIPLGGFVKLRGEDGEDRRAGSFASASKGRRFAVLIAGVTMNLVLAWVLLSVGYLRGLPTVLDGNVEAARAASSSWVEVVSLVPGSPAEEAGLMRGDRILAVDGVNAGVMDADAVRSRIKEHPLGESVALRVARGKDDRVLSIPLKELTPGTVAIGTHLATIGFLRFGFFTALWEGLRATWAITVATVFGFVDLLRGLFAGSGVASEVSGPVGIAVMTGEMARRGLGYLLYFAALLSVNLAVLNVLPIPALDGGRVLFLLLEVVRRRPVTARLEQWVHGIGFAALLLLVGFVTIKDISGLF